MKIRDFVDTINKLSDKVIICHHCHNSYKLFDSHFAINNYDTSVYIYCDSCRTNFPIGKLWTP